jgi:hypothetical protein
LTYPLKSGDLSSSDSKKGIMSKVSQVQKKVQSILSSELGSVNVDADGNLKISYESTLLMIKTLEFGEKNEATIIEMTGVVSMNTPASPKLYKYLNEQNGNLTFGALVHLEGDKSALILLKYSILGDFLDPEELLNAVRAVILMADLLDDEITKEFGGTRFIDR